ncbi:hypothetical protein K1719_031857 [Acacia pycnantha]|nr:hypothetical protein K1719_031857 [Acacia pycnantha]
MAIQVAATTSSFGFSSKSKYRYDVFLSFRGEDTRKSFTVHLYDALRKKGINAFIDDKKLGKGERIAPALLKAIERSRISIIVFSKNYATSTWCLDELAHIIKCKEEKKQLVVPIFYKVDPMDVQYQRNTFQEAMAVHEDRFKDDLQKVRKWSSALFEAARLSSAWLFLDGYDESVFIESIVEHANAKLPPKRFHNVDHIVGLEPCIEELMSLLNETDDNSVCMLGIHGIGGIGKTTLAKALYNSIFYRFEEILEEKKMKFSSVDEGISKMKHRLSHKKVLLVLDDVDEVEQLEQLAGGCDWFGCRSKIIITTRNKQLLIARNVKKTYEMMELNEHYSLELFSWHAFHLSQPPKGYKSVSVGVTRYVRGLPLALKLIGSNLAHRNLEEWRQTLKKYNQIPGRTTHDILKISYDCLQDGAKRIFLDIACFFKDDNLEFVEDILGECYYGTRFYIEVLVDKSLIIVDDNGRLKMHDLIQQMGREIVKQEAASNLGKCSRLWYYKDVLNVLRKNLGGNDIEGILLDPPQQEEVKWNGLAFEKMNNLRILIIRNTQFSTSPKYLPNSLRLLDWKGYPSMTLPPDFSPPKLVCFKLYGSLFKLEEPFQKFEYVTYMNFSKCEFIREVPDLSHFQNLKTLTFHQCRNMIKVHDSVGSLCKLIELDVGECTKLKSFPREINMPSLQLLTLSNCKSLDYFPQIVGRMDSVTGIYAGGSAVKELPPSIGNLSALESLVIGSCKSLRDLPNSLLTLQNLSELELGGMQPRGRKSLKKLMQESQPSCSCTNLERLDLSNSGLLDEDVDLTLKCFQNVQELTLSRNDFVSLPECIKECANLSRLEIDGCKRLRHIPELPSRLLDIFAENCTSLSTESSGGLWSQINHAKEGSRVAIIMPATTFPDWFDYCSKGGTLSLRVRGKIFPRVVVAFETGKAKTRKGLFFRVFMRINDRKMSWLESDVPYEPDESRQGRVFVFFGKQGHVVLFDVLQNFREEELEGLNKFLELDWNDVDIQVMCNSPDMSIVNCGICVDKQQTDMENIGFVPPRVFSLNSSRTSLKRKAITSPLNESANKLLRNFKAADKGKLKRGTKRRKRHQFIHSWYKMFYPMGKHFWRFLYY